MIFLLENDGKNYQQIADFLGCSTKTVNQLLNQGDLVINGRLKIKNKGELINVS